MIGTTHLCINNFLNTVEPLPLLTQTPQQPLETNSTFSFFQFSVNFNLPTQTFDQVKLSFVSFLFELVEYMYSLAEGGLLIHSVIQSGHNKKWCFISGGY